MPGRKKMSRAKRVQVSGKYMLASVIVEALLLAPKTKIPWNGKEIEVGGVFPMLQKEIAAGIRDVLNAVIPKAAVSAEQVLRGTPIKDTLLDKAVWFIYDYMEQYPLNAVVMGLLERTNLVDVSKVDGLLRSRLENLLASRDNRQKLVDALSDLILGALGLTGGASDNSYKFMVSDLLDRALQSEAGSDLIEKVLLAVEQFETLTLASFIERTFGLDRAGVEKWIAENYERYAGSEMVGHYTNLGLGDALYAKISNMDYDAVFKDITQNHWQDLIRVTMTAASVGVYLTSVANRMDEKDAKKAAKKEKKQLKKSTKKAAKADAKAAKKAKKKKK